MSVPVVPSSIGGPSMPCSRSTWVLRHLLALGAVLAVLTGCSDSAGPAASPDQRPMNPDPRPGLSAPSATQWLDRVCTALLPAARSDQPPAVLPTDPVGTRDRWADYLERRAATLGSAVDGINAAGPAPVEGGQQVTDSVTTLLRSRAETARASVGDLRAVPANAEGTLLATVEQVRNRFPLTGPATSLRDLALTPPLTATAPEVASCRAVGTG